MYTSIFNSNSLGDRKNVQTTKSSNYRDSNYRSFYLEIFKRPENFSRISKSSNHTSSHYTRLTAYIHIDCKQCTL